MKWKDWYNIFGEDPLYSELILSQREKQQLERALNVLSTIRQKLENEFGEDDAFDVPQAEPWILAESYLSGALDEINGKNIKLPAREN